MQKLYDIRVELLDVEPRVWRRILVGDDMSLIDLNSVIQGAMGWQAAHLSAFEIEGQRYDIAFKTDDPGEIVGKSMTGILTRDLLHPGVEAAFEYDFGDSWWHRIEVLEHRPIVKGDQPPRCIDGARACPPEDSGGPFGYAHMLDVVSQPSNPEHQDIREWLGPFDPERFDIVRANREIREILKVYRKLT